MGGYLSKYKWLSIAAGGIKDATREAANSQKFVILIILVIYCDEGTIVK